MCVGLKCTWHFKEKISPLKIAFQWLSSKLIILEWSHLTTSIISWITNPLVPYPKGQRVDKYVIVKNLKQSPGCLYPPIHQKWSLKWKQMYLPDDRNDASLWAKEIGSVSKKLEVLIEKCCIWWVSASFKYREPQIASTKLEESLQWTNSSDVNVLQFWLRSLHNPSACKSRK